MAGKQERTGKLAEMNSLTEQLMHREMSQLLETQEVFTHHLKESIVLEHTQARSKARQAMTDLQALIYHMPRIESHK